MQPDSQVLISTFQLADLISFISCFQPKGPQYDAQTLPGLAESHSNPTVLEREIALN